MPISAADIKSIVAAEDDFGHEMRVGAAIQKIGCIELQHGGTYTDTVTGKPRQFDYRCMLAKGGTPALRLEIPAKGSAREGTLTHLNEATRMVLTVECKNLNPSFPLVVCGRSRQEGEAFNDLILSTGQVDAALAQRSRTIRAKCKQSYYREGDFVGKSFVRLKPESPKSSKAIAAPDTDIYEKWAQALSSAVELAETACYCAQPRQSVASAVVPAVVVPDESLWQATYRADGTMESDPKQVGQCEYFVGRQIQLRGPSGNHSFIFSHIHFFTITAFNSFLSKMAINDRAWESLFAPGLLRFEPGD
jgi:hypothetical protein